ncbi:MAG: D-alanine--D-alanine ligase [Phycisphaerales bacterium]|nr:D-alanine--D-alanine ligase [Phycisphaerales bacterium]
MMRVLVLGGGPDAEREISLKSSGAVHKACLESGFDAELVIVDRPSMDDVRSWVDAVVFPVLHGRFGEGGELQAMMEEADIRFVGSGSRAGKLAMDKMGTKLAAARLGIPTASAAVLDPSDVSNSAHAVCPIALPVVVKPVADGSSVGLHLCDDEAQWKAALNEVVADAKRVYMIEQRIRGRELTVGVIGDESGGLRALPIIEIAPKEGTYNFEAKYNRSDTVYTPNPRLGPGVTEKVQEQAVSLCKAIGVRHLARVDFLAPSDGSEPMVLEVNTMPGFTASSLYPMASRASGMELPALCTHLIHLAAHTATVPH